MAQTCRCANIVLKTNLLLDTHVINSKGYFTWLRYMCTRLRNILIPSSWEDLISQCAVGLNLWPKGQLLVPRLQQTKYLPMAACGKLEFRLVCHSCSEKLNVWCQSPHHNAYDPKNSCNSSPHHSLWPMFEKWSKFPNGLASVVLTKLLPYLAIVTLKIMFILSSWAVCHYQLSDWILFVCFLNNRRSIY